MNARQKAKNLKKKIDILKSDNDLMRRIIADSPTMQELYDAYNKPVFVTQSTMQFQEYRARKVISPDRPFDGSVIEILKSELINDLSDAIMDDIAYEVDAERRTITASIFVGRK